VSSLFGGLDVKCGLADRNCGQVDRLELDPPIWATGFELNRPLVFVAKEN
jgi:hypothetical protein